jgi:Transposase
VDAFVGLDWGEQHHQVHALDAGGRTTLEARVPHDRDGLEALRAAE